MTATALGSSLKHVSQETGQARHDQICRKPGKADFFLVSGLPALTTMQRDTGKSRAASNATLDIGGFGRPWAEWQS
jgi:hypothetical protein